MAIIGTTVRIAKFNNPKRRKKYETEKTFMVGHFSGLGYGIGFWLCRYAEVS
jgi:hypothetical protein